MKRLLCIMLILVMAFGATAPVYAESWTSQQANLVTQGTTGILSMLTQLRTDIVQWMTLTGAGGQGLGATFQDQYILLSHLADWLVPTGARGANDPTLLDSVVVLTNYAMNHLPDISVIAGYVGSWMSNNNANLLGLRNALTRMSAYTTFIPWENAHTWLVALDSNNIWTYSLSSINGDSTYQDLNVPWNDGSPLGNIALELGVFNNNMVYQYRSRWLADLKHYNDQLSTWDSQGDTLEQVLFTPESAIQGLYRYLAFTQRDVARMAYIIADPNEQAGKANAHDSGVDAMYADVYDADNGGVTLSDMSDTFNTQKVAKQTFNTGVSFSTNGLFSFTDDGNWGFWSTAVKNDMDNVPMTRKSESYDSTAYDAQLEELSSIWGIKDGK